MNNSFSVSDGEEKSVTGNKARARSVIKFLLCMVAAFSLIWILRIPEFTTSQFYIVLILFFAIGLWITEVIPPFATGLLIIAFLVFALGNPNFNPEPQDIAKYANTFSSSIIWLMLGGFFLAAAMSKTWLDATLFSLTIKMSGTNLRNHRALPWDTLFLVAGGLSLGVALQYNGLLSHYAQELSGLNVSQTTFMIIFAFATMAFSNVMSHTATATVLIPLGMAILPDAKIEIAMIIGLAASTAMLLPVSTPPNAIAFSTGLLQLKDFRLGGILVGLTGPILVVLWILLVS